MGAITEHQSLHVNALSIGVVSGIGVTGAVRAANSDAVQLYANDGYSIYFPSGSYEFSKELKWTSQNDVKVWGDGAKLYQMVDATKLLFFEDCTDVEVNGLHLHGTYYSRRTPVYERLDEVIVYALRSNRVRVRDNVFEGNCCYAICVQGGDTVHVQNNMFRDGTYNHTTGSTSADINIRNETPKAKELIITGNHCNTNTLIGIMALSPTNNLICSNNMCITMDENGNELTDYVFGTEPLRKACIELQYYVDRGSNTDSTEYEMTIIGNKVQGARYSGISLQGFPLAGNDADGIRGVIANNVVRKAALEKAPSVSDQVQNGITVNNYRDLVITGNVVKDIENVSGNNEGSAGILVQQTHDKTLPLTGGVYTSCIISDNIVTDCRSRGIVSWDTGDLMVRGNMIRDCARRAFYHVNIKGFARAGRITFTDNRMMSDLPINDSQVFISGGSSGVDVMLSNNVWDYSGTPGGTYYLAALYGTRYTITGNRFKGDGTIRGLLLGSSDDPRYETMAIADNRFEDLEYAIFGSGNQEFQRGPQVHSNSVFLNCTFNTWALQKGRIVSGQYVNAGSGPMKIVCWGEANPQTLGYGNWIPGDVMWNTEITGSTDPMGWVCTDAGNPGTWIELTAVP